MLKYGVIIKCLNTNEAEGEAAGEQRKMFETFAFTSFHAVSIIEANAGEQQSKREREFVK